MEYFSSLTKQIGYEVKTVIQNTILSDLSIKNIIDIDDLNGNVTNVLVNHLGFKSNCVRCLYKKRWSNAWNTNSQIVVYSRKGYAFLCEIALFK